MGYLLISYPFSIQDISSQPFGGPRAITLVYYATTRFHTLSHTSPSTHRISPGGGGLAQIVGVCYPRLQDGFARAAGQSDVTSSDVVVHDAVTGRLSCRKDLL